MSPRDADNSYSKPWGNREHRTGENNVADVFQGAVISPPRAEIAVLTADLVGKVVAVFGRIVVVGSYVDGAAVGHIRRGRSWVGTPDVPVLPVAIGKKADGCLCRGRRGTRDHPRPTARLLGDQPRRSEI